MITYILFVVVVIEIQYNTSALLYALLLQPSGVIKLVCQPIHTNTNPEEEFSGQMQFPA